MKVLKIGGVLALTLSLVFGMALPALAAPPGWALSQANPVPPKVFRGEVVGVDEGKTFFVIQFQRWELIVSVDEDTQYFKAVIPQKVVPLARGLIGLHQQSQGRFGLKKRILSFVEKAPIPQKVAALVRSQLKLREQSQEEPELGEQGQEKLGLGKWLCPFAEEATFDDITVGTQVVVRAISGEDNPLAKQVFIIEPTTYVCTLGTVTDISSEDKTITIAPADEGEKIVLNYNESTRFILRGTTELKGGDSVRAIYDEDKMARVVSMVIKDLE